MQTNQEKFPKTEFAKKEEEILDFWDKAKIFEKSVDKEAPHGDYVFYDGPPFGTGEPHYGHILSSDFQRCGAALLDYERLPGRAALGLGLPWPADREYHRKGHGHQRQERDREDRDREIQRSLPGAGTRVCRIWDKMVRRIAPLGRLQEFL